MLLMWASKVSLQPEDTIWVFVYLFGWVLFHAVLETWRHLSWTNCNYLAPSTCQCCIIIAQFFPISVDAELSETFQSPVACISATEGNGHIIVGLEDSTLKVFQVKTKWVTHCFIFYAIMSAFCPLFWTYLSVFVVVHLKLLIARVWLVGLQVCHLLIRFNY